MTESLGHKDIRQELIRVGRDAMGRNDGWRWWHPRHLERLLDVWEPLIRAEATSETLDFCCADTRPQIEAELRERLRAQVEALPERGIGDVIRKADVLALLDGEG